MRRVWRFISHEDRPDSWLEIIVVVLLVTTIAAMVERFL